MLVMNATGAVHFMKQMMQLGNSTIQLEEGTLVTDKNGGRTKELVVYMILILGHITWYELMEFILEILMNQQYRKMVGTDNYEQ